MPCYHPITALQPTAGGRLIFPQEEHHYLYNDYRTLQVPCGQCRGCRLTKSRHWAIRCLHEKQMHKKSCFITLTYDEQHLPPNGSLNYRDMQLFLKRLRSACGKIRFYLAGEYGELGRPHYHAIIFGVDFPDKIYIRRTPAGSKIYRSPTLEKLWTKGFSSIGDVTFESVAYVARYLMNKRTGDGQTTQYEILDLDTGELTTKKKEFNQMSRRPGIGSTWLQKYQTDVYTLGKTLIRGHLQNPPRYYDKQFKKIDQAALEEFQYLRYLEAQKQTEHHTPERLAVQEQVAAAKTKSLRRNLPEK